MSSSRLDALRELRTLMESGRSTVTRGITNDAVLTQRGIKLYRAKQGWNQIKVMPPGAEYPYFGLQIFVHSNIGASRDRFICPRLMRNTHCPICDEYNRLRQTGRYDDKDGQELLRSL